MPLDLHLQGYGDKRSIISIKVRVCREAALVTYRRITLSYFAPVCDYDRADEQHIPAKWEFLVSDRDIWEEGVVLGCVNGIFFYMYGSRMD